MVKQDVLLDLLPEGGWIDLHKPRLTPLKNEELTLWGPRDFASIYCKNL